MAVYFFMALGAHGLFSFFASFPLFGLVTDHARKADAGTV